MVFLKHKSVLLADPGKARGWSTNTSVIHSFISWISEPFIKISLQQSQAQTGKKGAFSNKLSFIALQGTMQKSMPNNKFAVFWCVLLTKIKIDSESLWKKFSIKQLRKKKFPKDNLTLVALRGGKSAPPPLRFFRSNFFLGNFFFAKPTLTIIILVYHKLWQTLKKMSFHSISKFYNGGADLPPLRAWRNSGSPGQLGQLNTIKIKNMTS